MAAVNILDAFGYKWAQTGVAEALDDAQYKAGWAFIGATPPSVEQFNKVHQIADEKANWLYAQMLAVFTAAGEVPSVGDLNSLRDSITTLVNGGRLLNVQVLGASGTFTRTAGATRGLLRMCGGGAGGTGSSTTTASQVSAGVGGGSGAYLEHWFTALPASQAFVIGSAGAGGAAGGAGGAGGSTTFGALTAPGAPAGNPSGVFSPPWMVVGSEGAAVATGGNIVNAAGAQGGSAFALASSAFISGGGAASPFGGGGKALGTTTSAGFGALSFGAGGGGGICGSSTPGMPGGGGGAGRIIIYEFA